MTQRTFTPEFAASASAIATQEHELFPEPLDGVGTTERQPMSTAVAEPNGQLTIREPNPFTLLQQAIDANVDPDRLERIMAMYERWEDRQAEKAFAEAMTACQKAMKPIERKAWNVQTKSHYAALDQVHDEAKPIWLEHGFTLSSGSEQSPIPEHYRAICDVRHIAGHTVRYYLDGPSDEKGMKGNPNKTPIQGVVSTMSYLERKLTCMIFNLTIKGEDKDGNGNREPISEKQEVQLIELLDQFDDPKTEKAMFLRWLEVANLSEIPQCDFQKAVNALSGKLNNARR